MGGGEAGIEIDGPLIEGKAAAVGVDVAVQETLFLGPQVVIVGFKVVGGELGQHLAFALA
jgi:hypothetical protein